MNKAISAHTIYTMTDEITAESKNKVGAREFAEEGRMVVALSAANEADADAVAVGKSAMREVDRGNTVLADAVAVTVVVRLGVNVEEM